MARQTLDEPLSNEHALQSRCAKTLCNYERGSAMDVARLSLLLLLLPLCLPSPAMAGAADVVEVEVSCNAERICQFDVTVRHDDEGWDHYANRWEVLSPDGEIIATRVLAHPHENEQPFTRSLGGVKIPAHIDHVILRAHDSVHEHGGMTMTISLPG